VTDSDELAAEVLTGALERVVAARELREMGITPDPASTEAWLAMSNRQREKAALNWAIYQASGFFA